jgi:hypothetical protein
MVQGLWESQATEAGASKKNANANENENENENECKCKALLSYLRRCM